MILVVDDDPRILSGTVAILKDAGLAVQSAADGFQAMEIIKTDPGLLLMITDVLMPGMKGTELTPRALAHRPDLKVIYMSGDTGDTSPDAFANWPLIAKPFTAALLLRHVHAAFSN